ncbi:potassium voltage-gated channel subfamily B member 2-like, partial [Actinia tenebrosa]|uniref:Potassium voltage-gated channel subfamily B member 2-like n=1 Tax=Actinia tenebrosa TaxID=6105 RepID=A0A6P8IDW3_ACTTE
MALSIFVILVVSTQMTQSSQQPTGVDGTADSNNDHRHCDSIPVSVAVLPWPPYVGNVSNDFQSKVIQQLRDEIIQRSLKNPITFRKTSSESELKKLFKANQTDIGFPLIGRYGSAPSEVIGDHPGLEFLVAPQTPSPGEVCMNTLRESWPLLALSLILSGMAGILIWLMEVIGNRKEFPRSFARGPWEGFWWAFISMTTVGYGDKCPRSVAGRCFAIIWIFAGLILVAVFMANVTTALTSVSIKPEYKLSETEVGVVSKSLEEELARNNNAEVKVFKNYDELMTAFRHQRIPGIVIDRYTAGVRLENETGPFRQHILQGKHFSLRNKYQLIANISSNFEKIINDECDDYNYEQILECIEEVMTKHLLERKIQ